LEPRELAPGVYALMADKLPRDNNGVIVGDRCALVVDAGINGAMARQIQEISRRLTDRPIRYLANTTYHGDHTFGNAAFPDDVAIVSSVGNKASMRDLAREKHIRARNLHGNEGAIADVRTWRTMDVAFDRHVEIDLGGQTVELWHFGPGNGPGDTIVYAPRAGAAWTGNFLGHAGIAPMLLEGGPGPYIASLEHMRDTLDAKTIVPGHGPMGDAPEAIAWMIAYLRDVEASVRAAIDAGQGLEEAVDASPLPERYALPQGIPHAAELNPLMRHLNRLNVFATYKALAGTPQMDT
jgi:cyclase